MMPMDRRSALRAIASGTGALALGRALSIHPYGSAPLLGAQPPLGQTPTGGHRSLEPFTIEVAPETIDDLHRRIDAMRWPEMPFDTGWNSGTSDVVLRELVNHWRHEYDWWAVQDGLNQLNHLRGPIEGEAMHCVVYEGSGPAPRTPVLLLHGWPGSFHEFSEAAPLLAAAGADERGIDLVVPSLPGFVFSDAPRAPGMHIGLIADRLHLLMRELGHVRYGVQGGDWGAIIGTQVARQHPEAVIGLHLNFVSSAPQPPDGQLMSEAETEYRRARERFQSQETGYSAIQGTKPQSLAYAQNDSPVGWLAWMLEKYWSWSDHSGDLWQTFTRDQILTTAMLYWLPGRILSAARIYQEASSAPPESIPRGRVEVPTGYARFPEEPWGPPREVVERTYNLVHYSEMERGGHFPALEQPEAWARDVGRFFRSLE